MKIKLILTAIILLAGVLRLYHLGITPPGLYIDEASIGYNAYSILETGKDEWGNRYPLLFKAFGEYKLPVYVYSAAVSEKIFGANDFAVRLPSALAGILAVVVIYFLSKQLINNRKIALLTAFLLAILPWHLQFSRGGFEGNLAFTLIISAVLFFQLGLKNYWGLIISGLLVIFAAETYLSARLFGPIFFFFLVVVNFNKLKLPPNRWFFLAFSMMIPIIMLAPSFLSAESSVRFQNQSIFMSGSDLLGKFQQNFINTFSFNFLFFNGDPNPRHGLVNLGELYLWQLPVIGMGIYHLLIKKCRLFLILFFWLVAASLPVALSNISPHALRGILMIFPWLVFCAVALVVFFKRLLAKVLITVVVVLFCSYYLHSYYVHIPSEFGRYWGEGIEEAVDYMNNSGVSEKYYVREKPAYIYYLWYSRYNPAIFLQSGHDVNQIDKYYSYNDVDWNQMSRKEKGSLLVLPIEVGTERKIPFVFSQTLKEYSFYEF